MNIACQLNRFRFRDFIWDNYPLFRYLKVWCVILRSVGVNVVCNRIAGGHINGNALQALQGRAADNGSLFGPMTNFVSGTVTLAPRTRTEITTFWMPLPFETTSTLGFLALDCVDTVLVFRSL